MAKPVVNSKPPSLDPTKWIDRKKLTLELQRAIKIDKENKELLSRINSINRKGVKRNSTTTDLIKLNMLQGYVDTYNPFAYRRTNRWRAQEKKMKKIDMENKHFYQSLINTVG